MKPAVMISVVMPTYNCASLMERHLQSVAGWADLADEIVVVDSRSNDGTLDIIRERLRHPNLRIIERDRGLYESWNEGIAATSGDWIYISTAGDTIERGHLLHLLDAGERSQADVVISAPEFVDEAGEPVKDPGWPPRKIIMDSGCVRPFCLTADAGFLLAFLHFPCAILGSSASNLYRGDHLRARAFPTGFKGAGDSVWILRHAAQSRLCYSPLIGSTFCVHPKEEIACAEKQAALTAKLLAEKAEALALPGLDGALARILAEERRLLDEVRSIQRKRRDIWNARPRTLAGLGSWIEHNLLYLRKRSELKAVRRRIRQEFLAASSYQPVPPRERPA
jgi:hypothetical protein